MQEPFYHALASVFVQMHQYTATVGKTLYIDNERELAIAVGDDGVEIIQLSTDMRNEDFRVFIKRDNSLVVEMNEDVLPELTINRYVDKILKQNQQKKKMDTQQKYIVNKVQSAKNFINLINYRNSSIFKLILILAKFQKDFFLKGPKFLKPLIMKTVAEQIGLSESTGDIQSIIEAIDRIIKTIEEFRS